MGTPSYMAPEQARGQLRDIGPHTDVYALGAILYECLTGRPPFQAASSFDTVLQVLHADPVPPRRLQPRTPRDLETICLKCLHNKPAGRYASAAELADDLRRYLDGKPIQARPLSPLDRALRWARRQPAVAALLAAIVLCVAAGLALVGWQWQRAEREWLRAEDRAKAAGQARAEADTARRQAEKQQAHLALARGLSLCEAGEIDQGLLWLARALDLAHRAGATHLDRPLRVNLAGWSRQLSRPAGQWRHPRGCNRLAFSPDGRLIATAGEDGQVRFWDVASRKERGKPLWLYFPPTHQRVWHVAFSPDGKTLVTGGADARGVLWDVASRTRRHNLQHCRNTGNANVWDAAFSPDGQLVATAGSGAVARLWQVSTGKPVGAPLPHRDGDVWSVAFSPDGRTLYTAGSDGEVRRWNVATGKASGPPLPHPHLVRVVKCNGAGKVLLSGTNEGELRLWDCQTMPGHGLRLSNCLC
jgi:hypothetical protein